MNSCHILVIEDNPTLCDMVRRRLNRRGYHTTSAGDGNKGLQAAKDQLPHLILLDMSLPGMDGWTVATRLRQSEQTRHIPIIALTAHAMQGDRERALEAGCDEFETKPINFERLFQKIDHFLTQIDEQQES
ncbi:response regulator [Cerasicoccus arenae]|uniref:Two-component system response regulator n=1 Tax=Cerasicoccus arenae TaxID=424488 RepID=A0A8J3D9Z3_9BACT|nr:response regulator [Cerasicoccus arenae]MBK1857465.1 response regulator [Cerasicoccus arenae]GHB95182.1 two-component system response regulator [Cerasicoccus arenae]